jgi:hypothetical protein
MDKQQALYKLWHDASKIPCYAEGSVPDEAQLPYTTYETAIDSLDGALTVTATPWMRTLSWAPLDAIMADIEAYIGRGRTIAFDDGVLLINKATPFAQRRVDEDTSIKGYLISIQIEFLSK